MALADILEQHSDPDYMDLAHKINKTFEWDWYSDMSLFGGDSPFTYPGFTFEVEVYASDNI